LRLGRAKELKRRQFRDRSATLSVSELEPEALDVTNHGDDGEGSGCSLGGGLGRGADLSQLLAAIAAGAGAPRGDGGEASELAAVEDDDAVDSRILLHVRGCMGLVNPSVRDSPPCWIPSSSSSSSSSSFFF